MSAAETLLFSYHHQALAKDLKFIDYYQQRNKEFLERQELLLNNGMNELLKQESMMNGGLLSPEQPESIIIDKFVINLIRGLQSKVHDNRDHEKSFQVPFYLSERHYFKLDSLLFFRNILFESEQIIEDYAAEKPDVSVFVPMFKYFCRFGREHYDLESKKSSMLNHIPFLNFMIGFFQSLRVEVKENEYLRDESGNILVNQLLAIILEEYNMCGIISSDLSLESEEEWKNCIFISQIMQRRSKQTHFSLCSIMHGRKITFFYSTFVTDIPHKVFNKIQTWDICNAEHLLEIVGCIFAYLNKYWGFLIPNPLGCKFIRDTFMCIEYSYEFDPITKRNSEERMKKYQEQQKIMKKKYRMKHVGRSESDKKTKLIENEIEKLMDSCNL